MPSRSAVEPEPIAINPMQEALQQAESRVVEASEAVEKAKNYLGNLQAAQVRGNQRASEVQRITRAFQIEWTKAFISEGKPEPGLAYTAAMQELQLLSGTLEAIAFQIHDTKAEILMKEADYLFTRARVFTVRSGIAQGIEVEALEGLRETIGADFTATIAGSESQKLLQASDDCVAAAGRLRKQAESLRAERRT